MATLLSVNIATAPTFGPWTGSEGSTGIDKRPASTRVRIFDDHVEGDTVVDRKHHGGEHKAVYAYAREDALWWEADLGRALAPGAFGENLTTQGIDINAALIGERWRIGSVVLEVSEPRIPCRVFAGFWDRPNLIKEFSAAGRSGTYLRIIEAGDVGAGDELELVHRPSHGVTLGQAFSARVGNGADRVELLPALNDFAPKWQQWINAAN